MTDKRVATFGMALGRLPDGATIIETGCAHTPGDIEGAGLSTVRFAEWARDHGGRVISIDADADHIAACRAMLPRGAPVTLFHGDSLTVLRSLGGRADLLYLDSLDYPYGSLLDLFGGKDDLDRAVATLGGWSEEAVVDAFGAIIAPSQGHCLAELRASLHLLVPGSMVLVDDAALPGGGKARLAKVQMERLGWTMLADAYQTLWVVA